MKSKYSPNKTEEERQAFWFDAAGNRRCSGCKEFKSVELFARDKKGPGGRTFRCKSCVASYHKQYYRGDEIRKAETNRRNAENYYNKQYGLSKQDKLDMIERQNGCAICGIRHERMHVDHDHSTGKVRGVLCTNCNRGIGHLQEDIQILMNAINYLRHHNNDAAVESEGRSR